jgi:2-amino-4-hydroxy-6-hydroxymethyldihydropteridine diphosphokinase
LIEGRVFIGMGSNLGDRKQHIYNALQLMHASPFINVVQTSELYETEPVGVEGHPDYLNLTVEVATTLNPQDLLETLHAVEDKLGRTDRGALKPRTIDLEILLYGERIVNTESLVIPHPRMTERKFVLRTMLDIDRNLRHPMTGLTIQRLFDSCTDTSRCQLYKK